MALDNAKCNATMREASGNVQIECKLTSFFYELLRDHVPIAKVESLVRRVSNEPAGVVYTNGWLAKYAENVVKRLLEDKKCPDAQ